MLPQAETPVTMWCFFLNNLLEAFAPYPEKFWVGFCGGWVLRVFVAFVGFALLWYYFCFYPVLRFLLFGHTVPQSLKNLARLWCVLLLVGWLEFLCGR